MIPKDFEQRLERAIGRAVLDMHALTVQTLVRRLKRDRPHTGALTRSLTVRKTGQSWEIGTNLHYAPYVEFGTGLYAGQNPPLRLGVTFKRDWIRPKRAKFLRFEVAKVRVERKRGRGRLKKPAIEKKVVYAKKVRGMEPKWFLAEAVRQAPNLLAKRLQEEFRR